MSENNKTIESNGVKKWRTDYSLLLKCWSLIKTSEVIKDIAYRELQKFKAEDKAVHRLRGFMERNELKPSFEQSIDLWNKTIDQFINQKNYFAAAECMENLADIEFKYGSTDNRRDSVETLIRAAKYFKRCSQHKRAIIVLKRALTVIELSPKNDTKDIIDLYENCVQSYEFLELQHLAKCSEKAAEFFAQQKAFVIPNITSNEQPVPSIASTPSIFVTNCSEDESDSDNHSHNEVIDSKELVRQQITDLGLSMPSTSASAQAFESESSSSEDIDYNIKPVSKESKELLRKNLRNLFLSNKSSNKSEETVKKQKTTNETNENQSIAIKTTEITPVVSRKRRLKPSEMSEERPEKRIKKLIKLGTNHSYVVDPTDPLERLLCTLCEESILSYRWSSVTDHLISKKHKEFELKEEERLCIEKLTDISYNYGNYGLNSSYFVCNSLAMEGNSSQNEKSGQTTQLFLCSETQPADIQPQTSTEPALPNLFIAVSPQTPLLNERQCSGNKDNCDCSSDKYNCADRSLETPPVTLDSSSNPFQSSFEQNL